MSVDWVALVKRALDVAPTPFYLSAWEPVEEALRELAPLAGAIPVRHWLSFKTHPIAPLVRQWRKRGLGVEVVSEYEFRAAMQECFATKDIVVNGVAKHSWLSKYDATDIYVHFDSLREIDALAVKAKLLRWHVGLRCHVSEERDQDEPEFGGQFGLDPDEVLSAAKLLRQNKLAVEGVHFHLGTNLPDLEVYARAVSELIGICKTADIQPSYLDLGGGFPVPNEPLPASRGTRRTLEVGRLLPVFEEVRRAFSGEPEIWFENGRFVTARSAVLVIRVQDIKDRNDSRYLICDGGRTNHALVSDWETHDVFIVPERKGELCHTTICGPSCMAYDRLDRLSLPSDVQVGDYIVWMNAGAYHIPWETRFSRGLAALLWCSEDGELVIARDAETYKHWWGQWH